MITLMILHPLQILLFFCNSSSSFPEDTGQRRNVVPSSIATGNQFLISPPIITLFSLKAIFKNFQQREISCYAAPVLRQTLCNLAEECASTLSLLSTCICLVPEILCGWIEPGFESTCPLRFRWISPLSSARCCSTCSVKRVFLNDLYSSYNYLSLSRRLVLRASFTSVSYSWVFNSSLLHCSTRPLVDWEYVSSLAIEWLIVCSQALNRRPTASISFTTASHYRLHPRVLSADLRWYLVCVSSFLNPILSSSFLLPSLLGLVASSPTISQFAPIGIRWWRAVCLPVWHQVTCLVWEAWSICCCYLH